ncbi:putative ABC transport system permease protein [Thermocatellispora tengchongensis]|uniref:Putative ABC transport system permease protein n=1 Tax=Thermocatellispora tengchongensis TaxID=1073253 RepID=A0A840PDK1_9ACTN|nr:ABC transporter permease [Thermocatellispora tengchongensis]MBB5135237.1 putative ABC transport system permease protein [Thermocatellispora tengchongensis]
MSAARRGREGRGERLTPARMRGRDVLRVGAAGLRSRPTRVILSALGIAIGIATMVAVIGISSSSREDLLRQLDKLGTNLLTVEPGRTLFGAEAKLPASALDMVRRIAPVTSAAATGTIDATVRRTDKIDSAITGGIAVQAADGELLRTLEGRMRSGVWLNQATGRYPAVVLGSVSAQRLGVTEPGGQVYIGGRWFVVVGILDTLPLAPEIDRSALVGFEAAARYLGFDGHPTKIYERSTDASVEAVRDVLPRTVNPENPEEVDVSRPSDALAAKAAAAGAFTNLLLGLGAVALLVGGVGVANTMVISVLERRREIGLRRSLGATRGQVRVQFLAESLLLSALGGVAGGVLGAAATIAYATSKDWPAVVPPWAFGGAVGATLVIGTLAGLYPAMRAARLSPTEALATT